MELTPQLREVALHHPCGELAWSSKHVRWAIRGIADLDLGVPRIWWTPRLASAKNGGPTGVHTTQCRASSSDLRVHQSPSKQVRCTDDVPRTRGGPERLLRMAQAADLG